MDSFERKILAGAGSFIVLFIAGIVYLALQDPDRGHAQHRGLSVDDCQGFCGQAGVERWKRTETDVDTGTGVGPEGTVGVTSSTHDGPSACVCVRAE